MIITRDSRVLSSFLGAYILSLGRMTLFTQMQEILSNVPAKIMMINTDAILLATKKSADLSFLNFSKSFGALKNQIKDATQILSFYSISPTIYHISYISEETGKLQHLSKMSGFQLGTLASANQVTESKYKELILKGVAGKPERLRIDMIKKNTS